MKFWLLNFLLIVLGINHIYGQKVSIKNWVTHTIDSLQKSNIDTIEYYHAYCGECLIEQPPGKSVDYCETDDSWTQVENIIIYQQKGSYYSLAFNCNYPSIKKQLSTVNSLSYFISIVPVLGKRDRYGKALQKKHKFNPPIISDGGYEEAFLYCNKIKQNAFMQEDQKTDKVWRSYFWIDKETKLFELLESDVSSKN
jgi:hypothetical protein